MARLSTEDFESRDTILHGTVTVDACHACVKHHSMLLEEVTERTRLPGDPVAGPGQADPQAVRCPLSPHGQPRQGRGLRRARCCWDHVAQMCGRMWTKPLCRLLRF